MAQKKQGQQKANNVYSSNVASFEAALWISPNRHDLIWEILWYSLHPIHVGEVPGLDACDGLAAVGAGVTPGWGGAAFGGLEHIRLCSQRTAYKALNAVYTGITAEGYTTLQVTAVIIE